MRDQPQQVDMATKQTQQNTKLESEGAEFLVLGNLLLQGVSCFKAYVNFPSYDLVATNAATRRNGPNSGEKPPGR